MLRITRKANGEVVFKVSGQLNAENVAEVRALIAAETKGRRIVLDCADLRSVDGEAVKFLEKWEADSIKLKNCGLFIREWIRRERLERESDQPLSPDPLSDVKAAVLQLDRVGLPLLQKFNGLAIYRPQICTVQDNSSAFCFCRNECLHLRHVFRVQLTANLKDHFSVCLSRDPQHLIPSLKSHAVKLKGNWRSNCK